MIEINQRIMQLYGFTVSFGIFESCDNIIKYQKDKQAFIAKNT